MARALAVLAVLSAASVLVATSGGAHPQSAAALHYGDSLALGTGRYLPPLLPGWQVRQVAKVGRHSVEAPAFMRRLGGRLPRVLLISLGTNDDPGSVDRFAATVREVAEIAGSSRCVVWASIVRPPFRGVGYEGFNAVLADAARRFAGFRLLEWAEMARSHPEWLRRDGVHPSADGYRARAAALARVARSC